MDTRYAIILIEIKEYDIANIKKKAYNFYRNGILYETERI
jgi:hypothetical protein